MAAGIDYADVHGISALSLRSLGQSIGAATTAVYRYFDNKEALIVAMREELLRQAVPASADGDPRARLLAIALGFRATTRSHPCLSQIMGLAAVDGEVTNGALLAILQALMDLGLSGPLLVRGHRQLESFVVGTTQFDFSDAPRHIDERLERMRRSGHPDFIAALTSADAVEASNELAFSTSLGWLIDNLVAEAKATKQPDVGDR